MKFEINSTEAFKKWMKSIKDVATKRKLLARFTRLLHGNFGDHKRVDADLFELRFFFGSGIRIYYTIRNKRIIFLLIGGNKSTQNKDIIKAKSLLEKLE